LSDGIVGLLNPGHMGTIDHIHVVTYAGRTIRAGKVQDAANDQTPTRTMNFIAMSVRAEQSQEHEWITSKLLTDCFSRHRISISACGPAANGRAATRAVPQRASATGP
jgi:hypothetical protein